MKISVKGIGITKFGELWNKSLEDLGIEAATGAIQDSGLNIQDIDAVFVGNMLHGNTTGQNHLGALFASKLGTNAASFSNEAACSSGGIATHLAINTLLSGMYKNVLIIGVEKMTDVSSGYISKALMGAGSEKEKFAGLTFPGLYALMAKAHMQKFGTTREHLAAVSVKNHYHGSLNPLAHFGVEISIQKVLKSPMVAEPLTLFDASPISDGAAAIVLTSEVGPEDVYISGSAVASDTLDLADRQSLTEIKATRIASAKAFKQTGLTIHDINIAEVHDCFTIAEILAMENLGFCKKGEGGKFIASGDTTLGGKIPVNTSGGLKAAGHPVGATGIKQIVEITKQLRGQAGARQVKNAKIGLTHNVGGTGATVTVHILQK
jgi:acetyl-CoA C-acetyltransferase